MADKMTSPPALVLRRSQRITTPIKVEVKDEPCFTSFKPMDWKEYLRHGAPPKKRGRPRKKPAIPPPAVVVQNPESAYPTPKKEEEESVKQALKRAPLPRSSSPDPRASKLFRNKLARDRRLANLRRLKFPGIMDQVFEDNYDLLLPYSYIAAEKEDMSYDNEKFVVEEPDVKVEVVVVEEADVEMGNVAEEELVVKEEEL